MKRIISLLLVVVMSFGFVECSTKTSNEETIATEENEESKGTKTEMNQTSSKTLVAYFSNTGTTEKMAEYASEILDGDLFQIVAETPYTDEDLNYNNSSSRANTEQNDLSARPAISSAVKNMDNYDIVVIGYPIWHGQASRIICTFLESYDFTGKTIIPFCTSHSSDIGNSDDALHELCSDKANWIDGKRFAGDSTKDNMKEWLDGLNLQIETSAIPTFNLETKTVKLNSGYEMPINGLGTYSLLDDICVDSITEALNRGVCLIDTANAYNNEKEVGKVVRDSGIPREEIFVTTKLYPNQYADPEAAINEALKKLDIEYIDLMLLHHPGDGDVEAYKAMKKAVAEGKIHSIGLSCYYIKELEEFLPQVSIIPALVQNEIHPYYQDTEVNEYIQSLGIVVEGWYPLGGRGHQKELLSDPVLEEIAEAHNKSVAQVILRWNLQREVVVIPGSSNPDHIQENTELYDFELTDEEMKQIASLNRNEKHDWY